MINSLEHSTERNWQRATTDSTKFIRRMRDEEGAADQASCLFALSALSVYLSVCLGSTQLPNTALTSASLLPLLDASHLLCSHLSLSVNTTIRHLSFLLALATHSLLRALFLSPHELYPWTCPPMPALDSAFWAGTVVHQWWFSAWTEDSWLSASVSLQKNR